MTIIDKLIQLLSLDFNNAIFTGEEEGYYYFNSEDGKIRVYEVSQGYTVELFTTKIVINRLLTYLSTTYKHIKNKIIFTIYTIVWYSLFIELIKYIFTKECL